MDIRTADLWDAHHAELEVVQGQFHHFGAKKSFGGPIATVWVFEDNALVGKAAAEPGNGHVMIIDGGGSLKTALMGDNLAKKALENGWAGAIINGAIRDARDLAKIPFPVAALATTPRRSAKIGSGRRHLPVSFGGCTFERGRFAYCDEDGILLSDRALV